MIRPSDIKELVRLLEMDMDACKINRISVGLQTLITVEYADFLEAFGRSTACYCLGNEIRIDVDNLTFCAQKQTGVTSESELPEGGEID